MSGIEVIGGISAVISIIDAATKIYNKARKDMKLSEAFDAVGDRLPIIVEILQMCKKDLEHREQSMPANACEALEKIIDACDEKAQRLREIFEKVIPGEKDAWERRYIKIFRRLGKGNKIEELMVSITQDIQLLVNNHAVKSIKPEQNSELEKIIDDMKAVRSSVPEDDHLDMGFNSGGGPQTNNINTGSGQQINNNAPVTTQNFHSGKNS
jgi:cob(I)alamin adenosyltransferase